MSMPQLVQTTRPSVHPVRSNDSLASHGGIDRTRRHASPTPALATDGGRPHGRRRAAPTLALAATALGLAAASLSLEREARADDSAPPEFGKRGQVVLPQLVGVRTGRPPYFGPYGLVGLDGAAGVVNVGWGGIVGYSQSSVTGVQPSAAGTTVAVSTSESLWVAPSADVFVGRHVSLGAGVGVLYARYRIDQGPGTVPAIVSEALSLGVEPRIGYAVPIAQGLSFWPRLGVALSTTWQASSNGFGGAAVWSGRSVNGVLDLGVVYQPHRHLMVQVAPQIALGHSDTNGPTSSEGTWFQLGGEASAGLVF